jgi:hypothetical protein
MGMVALIEEWRELHWQFVSKTDTPATVDRIQQVESEMVAVVARSCPGPAPTAVSHGSITLLIDPRRNHVGAVHERSALFIDSILDPYGKIDRNVPTTLVADFDISEVAF